MINSSKLSRRIRRHKLCLYLAGVGSRALLAVLVALLAGCGERAPMLNSERIEATYGNYGIDVLEANGAWRVTNLYSTEHGVRTTRTYAEVRFSTPMDDALREAHAIVVAGGSIGEVFKSLGWRISKQDLRVGTDRLDDSSGERIAGLMRIGMPSRVALHEYVLIVSRDGRDIEYAVVTERHHPDYLTESDLRSIYGQVAKSAK